MKLCNKGKMSK